MGKREDILDAALAIVSRDGIQSLTMAKIQDQAGVGSGTMYNYFDGKETLLRALYQDAMRRMNDRVLGGYQLTGEVKVDFEALMRRFLDYSVEFFDQFNFTDQYSFFVRDAAAADGSDDQGHLFGASKAILTAGQAQGLVKDIDVALLQRIVSGVIVAVAASFYFGDLPADEPAKTQIVAACWDAIRAA
ncbi:MAG: TetR/AcrR family transcriptional regulator [Bifidobacteriaceae bacterium]|jgi:AcrR family transcriptional regulator|nr:TetR/AcrR family transcriptional regulator [Bifidobacteriaceae bacterium]